MAKRSEKLRDKSQKIHLSRTANKSIRMELIHTNAVKKRSNSIKVRGSAET